MTRSGLLALALLLAFGLLFALAPSGSAPLPAGSQDARPDGRLAFSRLWVGLGVEVGAWSQPPGELPEGGGVLWLGRAPAAPEEEGAPAGRGRLLDSSHYARFVRAGGTLVACLRPAYERQPEEPRAMEHFLERVLELPQLAALDTRAERSAATRPLRLAGGELLQVDSPRPRVFASAPPADCDVLAELALEGGEWQPWALARALGAGRLVLLADDRPFANGWLREADNALAAVRLLEGEVGERPLWVHEFEPQLWSSGGVPALLARPALRGFTCALLLWLGLLVWRLLRPRPHKRRQCFPAVAKNAKKSKAYAKPFTSPCPSPSPPSRTSPTSMT